MSALGREPSSSERAREWQIPLIRLLDAAPALQVRRERLLPIPGHVPEPWNMPPGCPFQPRCGFATDACALAPPPLRPVGEEHASACIRVDDLPPHQGRTARNVTNGLNDVLA